jgi:hypothetical protein
MTIFMFVGNTAPSITDTLMEVKSNGSIGPRDLTGAAVNLRLRSSWGSALLIDKPAVVISAVAATIRYDWALADTTTAIDSSPGPYKAWWHLDYGAGVTLDYPEFDVQFLDHNPRREVGPCTDWTSTQDVYACYQDVTAGSCLTWAVSAASEVLYEMSGRQFPGWCQSVIRPCSNYSCWGGPLGQQFLDRGHIVWDGWGWRGENEDPCSCGQWLQKVMLPGVAQSVVEVLINGSPLASSAYRLDPDNALLRTDGGAWPICQNMAAPGTAPGTFQVTYGHGYSPPEVGRRAAAQLAHEFFLACSGQACQLPSGVVRVVRQGITIERAANLFKDGATGLAMVDAFLTAYPEPNVLLVLSPDTINTDRRTS